MNSDPNDPGITLANVEGLPDKAILHCPVDALEKIGLVPDEKRKRVTMIQRDHDTMTETRRLTVAVTAGEIRAALAKQPAPAENPAEPASGEDEPAPKFVEVQERRDEE